MNSVSETLSTLNFGKNVTEITLGAAKRNAESGAAWEAKERAIKAERDSAGARGTAAALRRLSQHQRMPVPLPWGWQACRSRAAPWTGDSRYRALCGATSWSACVLAGAW